MCISLFFGGLLLQRWKSCSCSAPRAALGALQEQPPNWSAARAALGALQEQPAKEDLGAPVALCRLQKGKRKKEEKKGAAERPEADDGGAHLVWYGAADRANASHALSTGT